MATRAAAGAKKPRALDVPKGVSEEAYEALNLKRFSESTSGREGEVIVAAFHCISDIGIAATTTRAVAQRAGINLGSIHYYFSSKEALLLGVLKHLMGHKIKTFNTIRRSHFTPTQKIYYLLRSGSNCVEDSGEVVATISLWGHAVARRGVWQSTYRKLFAELRNELKAIIDEGIATGEFQNTDSIIVAETIIVAVQGISMHFVMTPSDFVQESLNDRLVKLFFRMLGVKESLGRRSETAGQQGVRTSG